jgi:hypothetical protein
VTMFEKAAGQSLRDDSGTDDADFHWGAPEAKAQHTKETRRARNWLGLAKAAMV